MFNDQVKALAALLVQDMQYGNNGSIAYRMEELRMQLGGTMPLSAMDPNAAVLYLLMLVIRESGSHDS